MNSKLDIDVRQVMENQVRTKEKPELIFEDLVEGRSFKTLKYTVSKDLVRDYIETVGDHHPKYLSIAPPGLAAIYARLSYLQDHSMPSGGVLVKQEFEFKGQVRIGDTLKVRAKVASCYLDQRKRKRVNFIITAKNQAAKPVTIVRLNIIWPK